MEKELEKYARDIDRLMLKYGIAGDRQSEMSGSAAVKSVVGKFEEKLMHARSDKTRLKYSEILSFLRSQAGGEAVQRRKLQSFCRDIAGGGHLAVDVVFIAYGKDGDGVNTDELLRELGKYMEQIKFGQTFQDMVNFFMAEKRLAAKDVYSAAHLSRQDFSRITTPGNGVKRNTVYNVAIGLKLTWEETRSLLRSAGYAFRDYSGFDMVMMCCISERLYSISKINELLYNYGLETLADNYIKK